jgi:enoyl-CoA hydratase/carnithine racemase
MPYSDIQGIRVAVQGGVAVATIDIPPMNLMGADLFIALHAFTEAVAIDTAVRVVVFRSADPDFFIAHGDLESILAVPEGGPPTTSTEPDLVHEVLDRLRRIPVVTIAEIAGLARGGGSEFAVACDMRFAAKGKAVFGQPEIGLGILPGAGGTVRLMRLLGRARAAEIIFSGADFSAEEAERYGWINRALPPEELSAFVDRLASRIARFPRHVIAEIKGVLADLEPTTSQDFVREQNAFSRLMTWPESRRLMRRALVSGWQTREGEQHIGLRLTDLQDDG